MKPWPIVLGPGASGEGEGPPLSSVSRSSFVAKCEKLKRRWTFASNVRCLQRTLVIYFLFNLTMVMRKYYRFSTNTKLNAKFL